MATPKYVCELECTVCFEIPKIETKVFQCINGHLFCLECYTKLNNCPTCRKILADYSDAENENGPIRCLLAENMIWELTSFEDHELEPLTIENSGLEIPSQTSEYPNKIFGNKMEIRMNSNDEPRVLGQNGRTKGFNLGGLGSTKLSRINQVIMGSNAKYGIYWGRRLPT